MHVLRAYIHFAWYILSGGFNNKAVVGGQTWLAVIRLKFDGL